MESGLRIRCFVAVPSEHQCGRLGGRSEGRIREQELAPVSKANTVVVLIVPRSGLSRNECMFRVDG